MLIIKAVTVLAISALLSSISLCLFGCTESIVENPSAHSEADIQSSYDMSELVTKVVISINDVRNNSGLPILLADDTILNALAISMASASVEEPYRKILPAGKAQLAIYDGHYNYGADNDEFDINAEVSYVPSSVIEIGMNVAIGYAYDDNIEKLVDAWMYPDENRRNILSPSHTHIGVGVAVDEEGQYHWAALFAGTGQ